MEKTVPRLKAAVEPCIRARLMSKQLLLRLSAVT